MTREEVKALSELSFKYCVPECDASKLSSALVERLILAQRSAGFQFTFTSAFRSQEWERNHGRKGTSSHCRGLAVDVSAIDSHTRYKVVIAAALAGISRIGIGKRFVHLDIDETKAHPIIFHYYDPQNT